MTPSFLKDISLSINQIAEYITTILDRAREMSTETLLKATAGSFKEAWRLVDATLKVAETRSDSAVTRTQAEDVLSVSLEAYVYCWLLNISG